MSGSYYLFKEARAWREMLAQLQRTRKKKKDVGKGKGEHLK
jgi:hypothetical protein